MNKKIDDIVKEIEGILCFVSEDGKEKATVLFSEFVRKINDYENTYQILRSKLDNDAYNHDECIKRYNVEIDELEADKSSLLRTLEIVMENKGNV